MGLTDNTEYRFVVDYAVRTTCSAITEGHCGNVKLVYKL